MTTSRKIFDFDSICVGELLGSRAMPISDKEIRACAQAIESPRDWYMHASPFGSVVAPPTIFDNESLRMLDERYERFGSIHSAQSWQFLAPVMRGSCATVEVRIVDKYWKRGGAYIVMDLEARDESEAVLCRGRHTSLMTLKKG